MARYRGHGVQHSLVFDVPTRSNELLFHHFFAFGEKLRQGLGVADGHAQLNQQQDD
jgi:hypothetical protein